MRTVKVWIGVVLGVLLVHSGFADGASLNDEKPSPFVLIEPANPWSNESSSIPMNGELHRLYYLAEKPPDPLDAEMLRYLNDPNNKTFVMLRQYVAWVRRMVLADKPKSDPYSVMQADDPIYFTHTAIYGESGPMTHINIANLILGPEWKGKDVFQAQRKDGKLVYAYISVADGPERKVVDLFRDRALFDQYMIHLTLRLLEGEARGQAMGLRAHLGAHTGPAVNLAFGTTWCQNRGFYEAWPLAQREYLHRLAPKLFTFAKPESLRERDRFLVFAENPWKTGPGDFEPLTTDRKSWNTPQAVLSSNFVNAWFLAKVWSSKEIDHGFEKSWKILSSEGSAFLREFVETWQRLYPEDAKALTALVLDATHGLTQENVVGKGVFACMGPSIWIGIPPKFDHVDFNASSPEEMTMMLSRLAERMPLKERGIWLWHDAGGTRGNAIPLLAQAIYEERAKRCGQFESIDDVVHFITAFSDQQKIPRRALMFMLQAIVESKVDLDQFYADERARLVKIGALKKLNKIATPFHVGIARHEITCLVPGKGMMGWGDYENTAQYVATPLYARAFVIAEPASHKKVVLVFAELCFISLALRRDVLRRLAQTECSFSADEIVLLANHTHSNQGGYSDSPVYSLSIPGVLPEVIAAYAAGIVEAIVEAHGRSLPMSIRMASAPFANDIPIGINRSITAYNRNADVTPVTEETRHLAMDRMMDLLRFDDESGHLAGCISWFGLHGTSVKQTNHGINADNKGVAAQLLETQFNPDGKVVCAFAQTTAGDISPNTIKFRGERYFTGPSLDGYENSRFSGQLQAEHAATLLERAQTAKPLEGRLNSILRDVDFSAVKISPEFSEGVADARTGEGVLGPAFVGGTPDGGGVPQWAVGLLNWICNAKGLVDPAVHGEKRLLLQSRSHRILGMRKLPKILDALHPALKGLRLMLEQFRDGDQPWVPQLVPVQLVAIGPLAIAALPAEPTTVAGARLRTVLSAALAAAGINHVVIAGYANAYSGYITTREEYSAQCYEGGHTLFGQWTCAAYQTVMKDLAREFSAAKR